MNEQHVELDTFRRILEAGFRAGASEDRKHILRHLSGPCPVCLGHLHDAIRSAETDWTEMPRRSDPVDRALYRYAALRQVDPVTVPPEKQPTAWIRALHLEACRQVPRAPLAFAWLVVEECRRFRFEEHPVKPARVLTEATLDLFENAQLPSIDPELHHDLLALLHAILAGDLGRDYEFELAHQQIKAAWESSRRGRGDVEVAITLEEIVADLEMACSMPDAALRRLGELLVYVVQPAVPEAHQAETAFRLGTSLCDIDKPAEALELLALARSKLPAGVNLWLRLEIHHARACAAFKLRDFRSACTDIEDARDLYEASRHERLIVERDVLLGLAHCEWHDWETAEKYLSGALDNLLRHRPCHDPAVSLVDRARILACAGDVDKLKALEIPFPRLFRWPGTDMNDDHFSEKRLMGILAQGLEPDDQVPVLVHFATCDECCDLQSYVEPPSEEPPDFVSRALRRIGPESSEWLPMSPRCGPLHVVWVRSWPTDRVQTHLPFLAIEEARLAAIETGDVRQLVESLKPLCRPGALDALEPRHRQDVLALAHLHLHFASRHHDGEAALQALGEGAGDPIHHGEAALEALGNADGDPLVDLLVCCALGLDRYCRLGQDDRGASELFEEAEADPPLNGLSVWYLHLAWRDKVLRRWSDARDHYESALVHLPGDCAWLRFDTALHAAVLGWSTRRLDSVAKHLDEARSLALEHGFTEHRGARLRLAGNLVRLERRWAEAEEIFSDALEAFDEDDDHAGAAEVLGDLRLLRRVRDGAAKLDDLIEKVDAWLGDAGSPALSPADRATLERVRTELAEKDDDGLEPGREVRGEDARRGQVLGDLPAAAFVLLPPPGPLRDPVPNRDLPSRARLGEDEHFDLSSLTEVLRGDSELIDRGHWIEHLSRPCERCWSTLLEAGSALDDARPDPLAQALVRCQRFHITEDPRRRVELVRPLSDRHRALLESARARSWTFYLLVLEESLVTVPPPASPPAVIDRGRDPGSPYWQVQAIERLMTCVEGDDPRPLEIRAWTEIALARASSRSPCDADRFRVHRHRAIADAESVAGGASDELWVALHALESLEADVDVEARKPAPESRPSPHLFPALWRSRQRRRRRSKKHQPDSQGAETDGG